MSPWLPGVPYLPLSLGKRWLIYPARNYWPGELADLITNAGFHITGRHWLWQTFENISSHQPRWVALIRPLLRSLANGLERLPFLCRLGVSQVVISKKLPD